MHLFSDFADSDRRATRKKESERENAMIRHLAKFRCLPMAHHVISPLRGN